MVFIIFITIRGEQMKINKKFVKLIIILLSISLIFLIYTIYNYSIKTSLTLPSKDKLLVHYIDVDQGDSILVQFNNKIS